MPTAFFKALKINPDAFDKWIEGLPTGGNIDDRRGGQRDKEGGDVTTNGQYWMRSLKDWWLSFKTGQSFSEDAKKWEEILGTRRNPAQFDNAVKNATIDADEMTKAFKILSDQFENRKKK